MKTKTPAPQMQTKEVLLWAQRLEKQKGHLVCKRIFDVVVSLLILLVTCPFFLLLAIAIKIDSRGPVFYRQVRVGAKRRRFQNFQIPDDGAECRQNRSGADHRPRPADYPGRASHPEMPPG